MTGCRTADRGNGLPGRVVKAKSPYMKTDRAAALYDEDFFAWSRSQARELRRFARTRPNIALDVEHIAEEIAELGTERRDALRSWTARIIEHLLLLEHSPAQEPRRGWIDEIVNFRSEIERRLESHSMARSEAPAAAAL